MATFRVGVGSFNLKDGAIGIGTEVSGHGNLKVEGTIKSDSIDVLGVSTFTRYSGFSKNQFDVNNKNTKLYGRYENLDLSETYNTTGDIFANSNSSLIIGAGSTVNLGSIESVSVKHHFSVPTGNTAQRDNTSGYGEGCIRYNNDLGTMEFFNGSEWRQFTYIADVENSAGSRGRAVKGAGRNPTSYAVMEYVNISTKSNTTHFGELSTVGQTHTSFSSATRGFFAGANYSNTIDYITIASTGNAIDYGDLTVPGALSQGGSSSTRGIDAGGWQPARLNIIDYVEMASQGNAVDFGDLIRGVNAPGATNNSTRMLVVGGRTPSILHDEVMLITIASKGNSVDIGTWTQEVFESNCGTISNNSRGIIAGTGPNINPASLSTMISYVNIDSGGNGHEFGSLTRGTRSCAGASSLTRGLVMGGMTHPSSSDVLNNIESISISSGGNSQDFGDLSTPVRDLCACSDSHGGLGGY